MAKDRDGKEIKTKLVAPNPAKTVQQLTADFLATPVAVQAATVGFLTQAEAQDVADAKQALLGGTWGVTFSRNRWNAVQTG
jgi:hypothetical protein